MNKNNRHGDSLVNKEKSVYLNDSNVIIGRYYCPISNIILSG